MSNTKALTTAVAKQAVESVVRSFGQKWKTTLSGPVQEALIAREVLMIAIGWRDAFTGRDVADLLRAALRVAELEPA